MEENFTFQLQNYYASSVALEGVWAGDGSYGLSAGRPLLTGLLSLESLATNSFLQTCCCSAAEPVIGCLDFEICGVGIHRMKAEVLAMVLCLQLSQAERVTTGGSVGIAVWYPLLKRNRGCSGADRAYLAALTP